MGGALELQLWLLVRELTFTDFIGGAGMQLSPTRGRGVNGEKEV
jgi:hypothetical protein